MSVENLTNSMNNITFDEYNESEYQAKFLLDNTLDSNNSRFVAKVQLSFYQIWSMFCELPVVYKSGKCKYEWKFKHVRTGAVFSIYDWNNKNKLIQTKTWYIGCNTDDNNAISEFLAVLCQAIECYNKYYKTAIEKRTFNSDNPVVQQAIDYFRKSISEQKEVLITL
jgi:hypothetical protein